MNNQFITALNGLRFYLFLLILATHYKYIISETEIGYKMYQTLHQGGIFAVLFFFILSGFCIALGYSEKFNKINKNNFLDFIKKRINKIYPLYLITGLIMLLGYYLPQKFIWLYAFIFLYIPMIAPYTPYPDGGGNGTGWFVSALFLCYVLTPFLIKFLKNKNLLIWLFLSFLCIAIIAVIPIFVPKLQHYFGFLYKFPPIRVFHYSYGLILGLMYSLNLYDLKNNSFIKKHTCLSEIIFILQIILMIFGFKYGDILNPILGVLIISMTIIYLCNIRSGFLYKLFTNKISQYLGNISFECYMIHYPLCVFLSDKIKPYCHSFNNIIIFYLLLLVLTIILSILYKYIYEKIKSFVKK